VEVAVGFARTPFDAGLLSGVRGLNASVSCVLVDRWGFRLNLWLFCSPSERTVVFWTADVGGAGGGLTASRVCNGATLT
jgi:hypothetical protein